MWHQKEPLGSVVYSHCPTNDTCNKCIHGYFLSNLYRHVRDGTPESSYVIHSKSHFFLLILLVLQLRYNALLVYAQSCLEVYFFYNHMMTNKNSGKQILDKYPQHRRRVTFKFPFVFVSSTALPCQTVLRICSKMHIFFLSE